MTSESEAYEAVAWLIGIGGFSDDVVETFVKAFEGHTADGPALIEVCETMGTTWTGFRPAPSDVLAAYRDHPRVRAEREDRINRSLAESATSTLCDSGWITEGKDRRPCPRCNPIAHEVWMNPERWARYQNGTPLSHLHEVDKDFVMPQTCKRDTHHADPLPATREGRAIAEDAYEAMYGRKMGSKPTPDPARAERIIVEIGQTDRHGNHIATFVDVLARFNGDYGTANASLNALGRRLTSALNGLMTLTAVPEASEIVYEPRTGLWASSLPPRPAEGAVDPAGMMAALAETAARFTDDDVL